MARSLPSASDAASRWQSGFAGSGTKWQQGIESVQTPPGQLAAAQQARYVSGVTTNANKWASKVAGVSLQAWKDAAVTKGVPRLATGAQVGMSKYQVAIAKVLQAEQSIISSLPPRGTVDQNIQRSSAFQMAMHNAFAQGG